MSDDLEKLIQASAEEDLEILQPGTPVSSPRLNRPGAVALSWLLLIFIVSFFYLNPVGEEPQVGEKSAKARLSVAIYQLAYRIEVYRHMNGQLPDFLEPSWLEARQVKYEVEGNSYVLSGQIGDYEIVYKDGDNPEKLMYMGMIR
ncbi:MAG: hypothetical protein O3B72_06230 [Proteobacteria bacterium]|nr:hypothetical protein [Pseudomonadota bacterium]